jgi:glycosyltransferase involved in cell wall biosynthesis
LSKKMIRTAFVLEQHLGHRTYSQNLRRFASLDARLEPHWVDVTYRHEKGLLERLPFPPGLKGTLRGFLQTRQGLSAVPCDAAVFNTQVPAVFAIDWLRRLPSIVCTDITPIQYDAFSQEYGHHPDRPGLIRKLKYRLNRTVFNRAALLVAWSSWVSQSFQVDYGIPSSSIRIIPPGVDLELWRPIPPAEKSPASSSRPVRILFVGGDFHRKGGGLLLDAFHRIGPERAELHLVTHEKVRYTPAVHTYYGLTPNDPELCRIYQESDIFVLPAQAEAFGIAAIEACASGLPVIASRVGGLVDTVEDGRTGFLVSPGNLDSLTTALEKLIGDPELRRDMGQAARARAETLFDARSNALALVDLVEETQKS